MEIFKNFWAKKEPDGSDTYSITTNVIREWEPVLIRRLSTEIVTRLADMWVKDHGAEVLKKVGHKEIKQAVEKHLAEKFWESKS